MRRFSKTLFNITVPGVTEQIIDLFIIEFFQLRTTNLFFSSIYINSNQLKYVFMLIQ